MAFEQDHSGYCVKNKLKGHGHKWGNHSEAIAMIQKGDDSGLGQSGGNGNDRRWSISVCILKVELIGLANGSNKG